MSVLIEEIREILQGGSSAEVARSVERFFKDEITLYGVKTKETREIGQRYLKRVHGCNKEEIFTLCEELWQSNIMEEYFVAADWSFTLAKQYTPDDFERFERWVMCHITNWATCDTFCTHSMGAFIERYPAYIERLKGWATSENRWVRREQAVSLILPARKGMFLSEVLSVADILLTDGDDMVQKGYGWLLKIASQRHEEAIFAYVLSKRSTMPRTALRYAIEKMPRLRRIEAMKR